MSWFEILLASVTVLVGSTMQGSVGFGMGLLASPVLMLIDPRFVRGLQWALIGRVVGTAAAMTVLVSLPEDQMRLVFGGLVLLGVGMSLSGLRLTPVGPVLVGAGALSGVMGTIASIGGPPMALLYQHARGATLRGTMSSFFWVGTFMSLVALRLIGRFGAEELRLTLIIMPAVLLGFVCSRRTAAIVDRGYTRGAVLSIAALTGLTVIARQLF